ncbi:GntR family transcriptional regulator [Sodalis sp. RH22]|uniref:GntR family transcriptional regulator n=1 Tax=unclassified Sodalis (in: enterobacteria) TaxID=2636512 RepID=UPI0039B3694F
MKQKKPGASANVANDIAKDINTGEFTAGMWLKQAELEERYGCTRADVRRALDQLVIERLVQHVPNKGYHVYAPNLQQRRNISAIRCILECAAAPDIVENIGEQGIARLTDCAQAFADATWHGTLLGQYEANMAFHRALLAPCLNQDMVELIFDLRSRVPSAPLGQWSSHARIEKSSGEHFAMVAAIRDRDAPKLARLIAQHIQQLESSGE